MRDSAVGARGALLLTALSVAALVRELVGTIFLRTLALLTEDGGEAACRGLVTETALVSKVALVTKSALVSKASLITKVALVSKADLISKVTLVSETGSIVDSTLDTKAALVTKTLGAT